MGTLMKTKQKERTKTESIENIVDRLDIVTTAGHCISLLNLSLWDNFTL